MERPRGTGWRHDALNALNVVETSTYMLEHHGETMSDEDRTEILEALRSGIVRLREILDPPGGVDPERPEPGS